MNPNPNPLPPDVVINGGRKHPIHFKDKLPSKEVTVLLLPFSKAADYHELMADVPKMVELLTGQPPGFGESLTNDSLFEISAVGRAINEPRFYRWWQRQREAVEKYAGLGSDVQLDELLADAVARGLGTWAEVREMPVAQVRVVLAACDRRDASLAMQLWLR